MKDLRSKWILLKFQIRWLDALDWIAIAAVILMIGIFILYFFF